VIYEQSCAWPSLTEIVFGSIGTESVFFVSRTVCLTSLDRFFLDHVYCKINQTFRFCNFLTMTSICVDVTFTTEYYIIADFEFVVLLPVWPYTSQS
jgi:hypothetical protein